MKTAQEILKKYENKVPNGTVDFNNALKAMEEYLVETVKILDEKFQKQDQQSQIAPFKNYLLEIAIDLITKKTTNKINHGIYLLKDDYNENELISIKKNIISSINIPEIEKEAKRLYNFIQENEK